MYRKVVPFIKRQSIIPGEMDFFWQPTETDEYKTGLSRNMNVQRRGGPWSLLSGTYRVPSSRPIVPFYSYSDLGGSANKPDMPSSYTGSGRQSMFRGSLGKILAATDRGHMFGRYPTRSRPSQLF